jgi:hypothetical protein
MRTHGSTVRPGAGTGPTFGDRAKLVIQSVLASKADRCLDVTREGRANVTGDLERHGTTIGPLRVGEA